MDCCVRERLQKFASGGLMTLFTVMHLERGGAMR